ncbi:MAG TPA: 5-deoxy-glucuronate isomerase [Aestuariivirgaceae bacterium]|nr:5-deoxy-glucuronate isomerase [Aestuariivirgaceae bacterium]
MSMLLVKPGPEFGRVVHVTPKSAQWTYAGLDLLRLRAGEEAGGNPEGREVCLVFIAGKGRASVDQRDFGIVGERTDPFEGKPWSVYAPANAHWRVKAETDVEIAVCTAPGKGTLPPRLIGPEQVSHEMRGKGTNTRYVSNILPEWEPAENLLVVEVITPGGNSSSYPPHKHDQDNLPHESMLEEIYYHRIKPAQGFAFQRIYTEDGSLDETITVHDGDVTLVPKGYHPCAALHGYDLYYLNVMAGPKRIWKFHNQKEHEWLLAKA